MHLNLLAFAIPLFLFFIAWEYLYSKRSGKNFFQYAESVANINVGIAERLLDLLLPAYFSISSIMFMSTLHCLRSGPVFWFGCCCSWLQTLYGTGTTALRMRSMLFGQRM